MEKDIKQGSIFGDLTITQIIAGAVCLLLVWITLSCGFDWPLPGGLEHKDRAAALVCLAGQITIMLLSLDVFTSGVMSVLRVRPGAESLIVLAGLAALADTAAVAITDNMARGLPYTVLSSATAVFALWGAWLNGRGFYDSFMTCFRIKDPIVVTRRTFTGLDEPGVLSAHGSSAGFIRRSEEPGPAESLAGKAFLPVAGASLLLSLLLSAGSGDAGAFFHIFSLLTGLGASFGWLLFCPLLFSRAARHLMYNGAAVAGWFGGGRHAGKFHLLRHAALSVVVGPSGGATRWHPSLYGYGLRFLHGRHEHGSAWHEGRSRHAVVAEKGHRL